LKRAAHYTAPAQPVKMFFYCKPTEHPALNRAAHYTVHAQLVNYFLMLFLLPNPLGSGVNQQEGRIIQPEKTWSSDLLKIYFLTTELHVLRH
jgi:hypothetical protein